MRVRMHKRLERLLLAERDRASADLHQFEEDEAEPQAVSAGGVARTEYTRADAASDVQEEAADFMMATRASARLAEVDEALRLLATDPDALGHCRQCGAAVEPERLEMVPWSRLCATCARKLD